MPILRTDALTIRFGGLVALDGVDLELGKDEILGIIGPNGAGKSTFINVVSGVYPPSSGRVFFDGRDVTSLPAHARCRLGIGRTFQLIHPLTDLNALQNIMVAALFGRGMNLREARKEAIAIADFLGLPNPERDVSSLTALEIKKMEIARALASRPKVLFLDEVMAGLNIDETDEIIDAAREIRARGVALCVVEHVMSVIRKLTDRVVVLDGGKVIADGPYEQVSSNERVISAYLGEED
ncbi:MAG TPA: ABC transporter ATP-binding protein [Candidatus Acetothermia bacterium]|jgi:branched-chain amino acid transport system ATP-binding protein|nr:ABC transporter ATP-binding protein [Candidatus Bipolaricaulota bacterium]RLE41294.1 MAG: ABC transporter ATP-binding protein [Candidatus Acetothermia bacterium]HDJ30016.1 ABC transporter ATP-binding protein [Candidatus Acetothermia bacterium]